MSVHVNVNRTASSAMNGMEAVSLNNQALQLSNGGDNAGAERLHKRALELKESAHGPNSTQAALTRNALGEVQLRQGKLEEAEENLRKAVSIRSSSGPAFDAAVSRDNLAQVLEAKSEFSDAKDVRDQGKPNKISCGNYTCPGQLFHIDALKQCSRCHCVYYCSVSSQKNDWTSRHKRFCKKIEA